MKYSAAYRWAHPAFRVRLSALLLCLLGAGHAALPAQEAQQPNPVIQDLAAGRFAEAEAGANALLQAHPGDCRLLSIRGVAERGMGEPARALSSFQEALHACPTFVPALEGAAEIDYAQHSPEARALLVRLIAVNAGSPTAHAMLAVLDWQAHDCAAALPHFAASAPVIARNPEAQREYAVCLVTEGDPRQALPIYTSLLAAEPENASLRMQLAFTQQQAADPAGALATLQPLLTPPGNARALALASQIAEAQNQTPQAVAWLRQAIVDDPTDTQNYISFASIAFNHASYQVGIDMIDSGLKVLPDSAQLYLARGTLQVQLSHYDQAAADFEQARRLDPHLSLAADAMGMMQSQQHHDAASLALFRKQVANSPNDALLQYLYAEALSEQGGQDGNTGHDAEAIHAAERAVALEPGLTEARDLLAVLYLRTHNAEGAARECAATLAQAPDDATALYQLILADRRLGRTEQIPALVARLQAVQSQQRQGRMRYQLEEPAAGSSAGTQP